MFTSFKESVNYHNFCLEALRYNKKQMGDWRLDHYWNFFPSIFDLGQHITNFRSKIVNNDLDASHYLYTVT